MLRWIAIVIVAIAWNVLGIFASVQAQLPTTASVPARQAGLLTPTPTTIPSGTATATGSETTGTATATSTTEAEGTPTATLTAEVTSVRVFLPMINKPALVQIEHSDLYTGCRGCDWRIAGHVMTLTGAPVYNVTLEARFYDQQGLLIYTGTTRTLLTATFPGEHNPFEVSCPGGECSVAERVTVTVTSLSLTSPRVHLPLTVVSQQVEVTGAGPCIYTVSGELRNDHTQTVSFLEGVILPRSPVTFSTTVLAPGATTTYTGTLTVDSGGGPCDTGGTYTVLAQGAVIP